MSETSHPLVTSRLPSIYGSFRISAFDSGVAEMPHLVLRNIEPEPTGIYNVRIHSECMTGDVFGSTRCDCGEQLAFAMKYIEEYGGVLIYLRQEGRGIGLVNKLRAYNLQDEGMDTISANHALGFHTDERVFTPAVEILKSLNIHRIRLITNNPDKVDAFSESGIEIVERIPVVIEPRPENREYLRAKKEGLGHWLHQF